MKLKQCEPGLAPAPGPSSRTAIHARRLSDARAESTTCGNHITAGTRQTRTGRANMSDSGATILVKLIKAEKLRTNIRGDPPGVMAKFRITGKRFWPNSNALVAL